MIVKLMIITKTLLIWILMKKLKSSNNSLNLIETNKNTWQIEQIIIMVLKIKK